VVVAYDLADGIDMKDVTVDTTTGAELAAINAADDDWYGLNVIDSSSKATALQVAAWNETIRRQCILQTADQDVLDNSATDDVMSTLQASAYARTGVIYHRAIGGNEWLAVGWLAGQLTTTPGSATPAFKTVAGVKVDKLSSAGEASILKKNGSHYTLTGGFNITFEGKNASGFFQDNLRFIDWTYARMREAVIGKLANLAKIPFTDSGVDVLRMAIITVIGQGITNGGFASDPAPVVDAPKVADVDVANRINRIMPDIKWKANLAGAIHRLNPVRGTVSI
jgi:hypothetical protein